MKKNTKITVLGGGMWGTVLAGKLCRNGARRGVRLWEFFPQVAGELSSRRTHPNLPGFRLDRSVAVTSDLAAAVEGSEVLLFVLSSGFVRPTAHRVRKLLGGGLAETVVNASKGVEPGTLLTMGEVLADELPSRRLYTLSGPSFAREVARGVPTRLLLAGPGGPGMQAVRGLFDSGSLRVGWSPDRKGVELGGSLKNVLAIGCGILDGLKAGANTKAALIIQGMEEMGGLIERSGGSRETIFGLAGLGDLIATGTSPESRNRAFGELLGKGLRPAAARSRIATVVEGIDAARSASALVRRLGGKAPIIEAVWKAVQGGPPKKVVTALGFSS